MEIHAQIALALTYLAQVRQRRTLCSNLSLKSVRTMRHTLLTKLTEKYGALFKETAIIGIVLSAELEEPNRSTEELLRVLEKWRSMDEYASSQSHARERD